MVLTIPAGPEAGAAAAAAAVAPAPATDVNMAEPPGSVRAPGTEPEVEQSVQKARDGIQEELRRRLSAPAAAPDPGSVAPTPPRG